MNPTDFAFKDILIALIGGLLGSTISLVGSWSLQHQAIRRQRQMTLASVMYELIQLSAVVEAALKDERRVRELRAPLWDRYGVQLVNYLPYHLFTAIWVIHEQFDRTKEFYERLAGEGILPVDRPGVEITLAGWAVRVRLTVEAIKREQRPKIQIRWPWTETPDEKLLKLMETLDKEAEEELVRRGYDVDKFRIPSPLNDE